MLNVSSKMENLIKEKKFNTKEMEKYIREKNMRREKLFSDQWSFHNIKYQQIKVISNMT